MGADVLEESNTKETAGDVAQRCNANKEIIQILRAAECFFQILILIMISMNTPF